MIPQCKTCKYGQKYEESYLAKHRSLLKKVDPKKTKKQIDSELKGHYLCLNADIKPSEAAKIFAKKKCPYYKPKDETEAK